MSTRKRDGDRLSMVCDSVKTGERSWAFSGIALGAGDRAGLLLGDQVVPAGTAVVV